MNFTPRPISKHYRSRLIAWTLSMLLWTFEALFAATLSPRHERQRLQRISLDGLTRRVKMLIVSRACDFACVRGVRRLRFSYRGCRNVLKAGLINALVGARVRRLLKRKGLVERIAILIHALRHIDDYATLVAKRIRRGLTRRLSHLFVPPLAPDTRLVTLFAPGAICVDSS
jgi:hypothetical protein